MSDAELAATDRAAVCMLVCCCDSQPSTAGLLSAGQRSTSYRQLCVQDTLDKVDKKLKFQSRFKAEVSYNMTTNPPSPYMHRLSGNNTTERSTNWLVRARQAASPKSYSPGQGLTRRPDVVIVRDPTLPPTQDNIAQIYELKFQDKEGESQLREYRRIAGGDPSRAIVLDPDKCDCQDEKKKEQLERKLQDSANQKDIDNIMRRNRINRWIGDMGGGSVGPLPVPGGIPIIP